MKICQNCGAYNSDERMFCVDCNEKLSDTINPEQQKEALAKTDATIEKLYNKKDPLYVSLFDKIVGVACIIFSSLLLVLGFVLMLKDRGTSIPFYLIIFGVVGALEAFLPQISWELEKLSLSFKVNNVDDLTPSSFYLIGRKIGATVCLIICLVGAVFTAKEVVHPPVIKIADTLSYVVVDYTSPTVEEIVENFPEEWDEIISGGGYTVSKYLGHLKKCNFIGKREQLMMKAIIEIEDLDMDFNDYSDAGYFILDYEYKMQLKNRE
jgi:hypothetical protein